MNPTNEVLEMWEADASRGHTDITAANSRLLNILRLMYEARKTANVLHERLLAIDPEYAAKWEARVA